MFLIKHICGAAKLLAAVVPAMENIFISLKSADQTPARYAKDDINAQDAQKNTVAKACYTLVTEPKNGTKNKRLIF